MAAGKISGSLPPPPPDTPAARAGPAAPTGRPFVEVLGERARPPAAGGPPPRAPPDPAGGVAAPLRRLLGGALGAERELDAAIEAARRGGTFSPAELIALQAKVFRYTQAVEVISRATDKVVGAVKQALGAQV
jgi:hypothetical protein